jgi:CRISPR-associated protein Csb2
MNATATRRNDQPQAAWRVRAEGPQAFRFALCGDRLPPVTAALRIGEAARATIYKGCERLGLMPLPDAFHGGDDPGHVHAFWLPEDADSDGAIDHLLLFAESGLPDALLPALAAGGDMWIARAGAWRLAADWMGRRAPGGLFGPAREWIAVTPYVTPRRRARHAGDPPREKDAPHRQLADEIFWRGLPAPVEIGVGDQLAVAGGALAAAAFDVATAARAAPPDAAIVGARLVFAEPLFGPLAFGFGCHFGLGLFSPVADGRPARRGRRRAER